MHEPGGRGSLGRRLGQPAERSTSRGLTGFQVIARGPGAKAGLKIGDRIVSFGRKPVSTIDELDAVMKKLRAGDKIRLSVVRGGDKKDLAMTIGSRPAAKPIAEAKVRGDKAAKRKSKRDVAKRKKAKRDVAKRKTAKRAVAQRPTAKRAAAKRAPLERAVATSTAAQRASRQRSPTEGYASR